jgi:hypothetical protein
VILNVGKSLRQKRGDSKQVEAKKNLEKVSWKDNLKYMNNYALQQSI